MDISSLLYSFGLSGLFSSRAFLPAFATSFAIRYSEFLDKIPGLDIGKFEFLQNLATNPPWFAHDIVFTTLGILAALELVADKSPEVRQLMDEFMGYAKAGLSAATTFGVMGASDAQAVEGIISQAGFLDIVPAALMGGLTYFFSSVRLGVMNILTEGDEDDELGIRGVISWFEELWTSWGILIFIALPFLMTGVIAGVMGILFLIQKRYESKMEKAKVSCGSCGERIHSFATGCHHCKAPVKNPRVLGFLGRLTEESHSDIDLQRLRLLALKRSPLSGEKVKDKGVDVVCSEDGVQLLGDRELTRRYISRVSGRLPKVLIISALWSLLPGIGLIFGVIYYRFQLVGPFRRYLSFGQGFLAKWLIRFLLLLLVALQLVPGAGAIAIPLMATINFVFYRRAFLKALGKAALLPA